MDTRNNADDGVEKVIIASISPFLTVSGIRVLLKKDGRLYLEWTGKGKEKEDLRDLRLYLDGPDKRIEEISGGGGLLVNERIGRRC